MILGVDSHTRTLGRGRGGRPRSPVRGGGVPQRPGRPPRPSRLGRAQVPEGRALGPETSGHNADALGPPSPGAGEEVFEVPPALADAERRRARRGKSDPIDALAIARISARGEGLSAVRDDPAARYLKILSDYRQVSGERTRTANRLHADLVQLSPDYQGPGPEPASRPPAGRPAPPAGRALAAGRVRAAAPRDRGAPGRRARRVRARLRGLVRAPDTGLLALPASGSSPPRSSSAKSATWSGSPTAIASPGPPSPPSRAAATSPP
jgi:hypothetical protein